MIVPFENISATLGRPDYGYAVSSKKHRQAPPGFGNQGIIDCHGKSAGLKLELFD
jgi:hypothetical protein